MLCFCFFALDLDLESNVVPLVSLVVGNKASITVRRLSNQSYIRVPFHCIDL